MLAVVLVVPWAQVIALKDQEVPTHSWGNCDRNMEVRREAAGRGGGGGSVEAVCRGPMRLSRERRGKGGLGDERVLSPKAAASLVLVVHCFHTLPPPHSSTAVSAHLAALLCAPALPSCANCQHV